MSDTVHRLIRLLADGERHQLAELAAGADLNVGEVTSALERLERYGIDVSSAGGDRVRLTQALDLLDLDAASEHFRARATARHLAEGWRPELALRKEVDSTSRELARNPLEGPVPRALTAEFQSAGQGRLGRRWLSPYASGICLSLAARLSRAPGALGALSLAMGVGVHRALAACGVDCVKLKWPNDLVLGDGKLGGILVQIEAGRNGGSTCIVGVGLNVTARPTVPPDGPAAPLPPRCLADSGQVVSRSRLLGVLLAELAAALAEFSASGFEPFVPEWTAADYLRGRPVRVSGGASDFEGVAEGIGRDGVLLVRDAGQVRAVVSGDVSVRLAA